MAASRLVDSLYPARPIFQVRDDPDATRGRSWSVSSNAADASRIRNAASHHRSKLLIIMESGREETSSPGQLADRGHGATNVLKKVGIDVLVHRIVRSSRSPTRCASERAITPTRDACGAGPRRRVG